MGFKSTLLSVAVIAASSSVYASATLKTDTDKASYAIGQQIGRNMKSQGVNINVDVLAISLKDALMGKDSQLTDQQMQEAMVKFQENMQKKQEEVAKVNLQNGNKFLESNKGSKGVKVTASGLQYKVVKEGKGESPKDDSVVKVHYKGTLTSGETFDSSIERGQPAEFPVNGVIKGWTEALKMMKPGAKWELAIPAELAYGKMGRPGIPPNSVLKFEVELLEIVKKDETAKK